jgi:hypothetical protein
MKKILAPFFLISLFIGPLAYATRDVDSSQKLNLLRQATGDSNTASNGFEARVNSLFDTTPDPAHSQIANQDAEARVEARAEEAIEVSELNTPRPDEVLNQTNEELKVNDTKIKTTEQDFVKESEELQKQLDMEKEERNKPPEEVILPVETGKNSGLPPSLANNPFYFAPKADDQSFEEQKTVIASRLIQKGFSEEKARAVVSEAISPDEIIINLMQDEEFTYGDAAEMVQTT